MYSRLLSLCFCLSHAFVIAQADEGLWPQFRGPEGNGIAPAGKAPLKWSETAGIAWKTPLEGKGWSSPVIADGQIWLTSAVEVAANEQERQAILEKTDLDPKQFKDRQVVKRVKMRLLRLDFATGKLLSTLDLTDIEDPEPIHATNSYASPTPVIDGDFIYCHFGTYGTFCIKRADQSIVWKRRLPLVHAVGPGSSPFIFENFLVLICDGVDRQYVTALNKMTGETVWERDRPPMEAPSGDMMKAYCTPVAAIDSLGRKQVICMGSQWLVSYAPETGEEIWRVKHGKGFSIVPRPVYSNGVVYISTGFGKPQLWAVKIDGSGDVTDTHVVWTESRRIPAQPSPLLVGEQIYVVSDDGIASCLEASSGKMLWSERLGGKYSSSPLLADGKIYFSSHEGITTVIRPSGNYAELAKNQLDGQIMASPVVLNGSMLMRTDKALYCIRE